MDVNQGWHATPKTGSQDTGSLNTRIAMNRAGTHPVPLHTWIARLLAEWLPDHARVVDLGCGTGLLGAALHDAVTLAGLTLQEYVGVDPSPTHRPEFLANAPAGSRLVQSTAGRWLATDDEPSDLVALVFSMYYEETDDLAAHVERLLARLRRRGRLLICGPVDSNNRGWFDTLRDVCGVHVPQRALHESYEYMNDVFDIVRRVDVDIRVRRYYNSVPMTSEQVRRYWRSVIYHDPAFDAAVDEVFADGVVIDKEVLYLEVARPGP